MGSRCFRHLILIHKLCMMFRKYICLSIFILVITSSGCGGISYLFHAARGQYRILSESVPLEEAIAQDIFDQRQKALINLVPEIKKFALEELGLIAGDAYEKVYVGSELPPLYMVSVAPEDKLALRTWWFPIAGSIPYLTFFDRESANKQAIEYREDNFDVFLGIVTAYSTLGWFDDPIPRSMLEEDEAGFVETLIHEMTHTTIYFRGQGEFNESIASIIGKAGSLKFLRTKYGENHPSTIKAHNILQDQRIYSEFLSDLIEQLEKNYSSSSDREKKLLCKKNIFFESKNQFSHISENFFTDRFVWFKDIELNNAVILTMGLYDRNFMLFEKLLAKEGSEMAMINKIRNLAESDELPVMESIRNYINQD